MGEAEAPHEVKPATTFEEQLDLLGSRNLVVSNREFALEVLGRLNYYRLTGYLLSYKGLDGAYVSGTTFETGVIPRSRKGKIILLVCKRIYQLHEEWGEFIEILASLIEVYKEHIELERLGFPREGWKNLLQN